MFCFRCNCNLVSQIRSRCIPVVGWAQISHHIAVSDAQIWRCLSVDRPHYFSWLSNQVPAGQSAFLGKKVKQNKQTKKSFKYFSHHNSSNNWQFTRPGQQVCVCVCVCVCVFVCVCVRERQPVTHVSLQITWPWIPFIHKYSLTIYRPPTHTHPHTPTNTHPHTHTHTHTHTHLLSVPKSELSSTPPSPSVCLKWFSSFSFPFSTPCHVSRLLLLCMQFSFSQLCTFSLTKNTI